MHIYSNLLYCILPIGFKSLLVQYQVSRLRAQINFYEQSHIYTVLFMVDT